MANSFDGDPKKSSETFARWQLRLDAALREHGIPHTDICAVPHEKFLLAMSVVPASCERLHSTHVDMTKLREQKKTIKQRRGRGLKLRESAIRLALTPISQRVYTFLSFPSFFLPCLPFLPLCTMAY